MRRWALLLPICCVVFAGGADEPRPTTERAILAELKKLAQPLDADALNKLPPGEGRSIARKRAELALDLAQDFATRYPGSPALNEARSDALKALHGVADDQVSVRGIRLAEQLKEHAPKGSDYAAQAQLYVLGHQLHKVLKEAPTHEEFRAVWAKHADEIRKQSAAFLAEYPNYRPGADAINGVVHLAEQAGDIESARFLRAQVARHTPDHPAARIAARERAIGREFELQFTPAGSARALQLRDLRGKVVVVHFWASWCVPCRAELTHLTHRYEKFHRDGLEIIGISLDEKDEDAVRFMKENKIPWPEFVGDRARKFGEEWGVESLPVEFVIDRKGRLRSTDAMGKLDKLIPELLAEKN